MCIQKASPSNLSIADHKDVYRQSIDRLHSDIECLYLVPKSILFTNIIQKYHKMLQEQKILQRQCMEAVCNFIFWQALLTDNQGVIGLGGMYLLIEILGLLAAKICSMVFTREYSITPTPQRLRLLVLAVLARHSWFLS